MEMLLSNVIHCLTVSVKLGQNRWYFPVFDKLQSQLVVLSLLCVQYHLLLRKAEFTKIIEKYHIHVAIDQ